MSVDAYRNCYAKYQKEASQFRQEVLSKKKVRILSDESYEVYLHLVERSFATNTFSSEINKFMSQSAADKLIFSEVWSQIEKSSAKIASRSLRDNLYGYRD